MNRLENIERKIEMNEIFIEIFKCIAIIWKSNFWGNTWDYGNNSQLMRWENFLQLSEILKKKDVLLDFVVVEVIMYDFK